VLWGAYVGTPYGATTPNPPPCSGSCELQQLQVDAGGKQPGIVMWYAQWDNPGNGYPFGYGDFQYTADTEQWQTARSAGAVPGVSGSGAIPEISWMSVDVNDPCDPTYLDQNIADTVGTAGSAINEYVTQWADGLKALGYPILLRFDHEMNGNWSSYAPGQCGNTTDSFKNMWIAVHQEFNARGVTNVQWVWSPNIEDPNYVPNDTDYTGWEAAPYADLYPGDTWVDWVAMDGYNMSGVRGNTWQTFDQVFGKSYSAITAVAPSRSVMIGEVSSVEASPSTTPASCPITTSSSPPPIESKGAWIAHALLLDIPHDFPAVKAVVFFDNDNGGLENYRVDSSPCSQAGFALGINSPYYADGTADSSP
jgi:hypothetical protein